MTEHIVIKKTIINIGRCLLKFLMLNFSFKINSNKIRHNGIISARGDIKEVIPERNIAYKRFFLLFSDNAKFKLNNTNRKIMILALYPGQNRVCTHSG